MKRLTGLVFLFLFFSNSHAQTVTPPAGEKENPFAKEYEKKGIKISNPTADSVAKTKEAASVPRVPNEVDSFEMQFLAEYIQDPAVSIGIFDLPGEEDRIRTLKNGKYPEEDSSYLDIAIHLNVMKLNSIEGIKGNFDSLVFVKMPPMQHEHDAEMTFYPFPSTRWLLFIKKGLVSSNGKVQARDWVGDLKGGHTSYSFLTDQTAFYLASAYYGSYYLKWGTEPIPHGLVKADEKFVSDVKDIVAFLATIPEGTDKSSFESKVETLKPKLRTDKARYLCVYLEP